MLRREDDHRCRPRSARDASATCPASGHGSRPRYQPRHWSLPNFLWFLAIDYTTFKTGWDPTGEWHERYFAQTRPGRFVNTPLRHLLTFVPITEMREKKSGQAIDEAARRSEIRASTKEMFIAKVFNAEFSVSRSEARATAGFFRKTAMAGVLTFATMMASVAQARDQSFKPSAAVEARSPRHARGSARALMHISTRRLLVLAREVRR